MKVKKYFLITLLSVIVLNASYAQDVYKRNESIDVQNYIFTLVLSDTTNHIVGESEIEVKFKDKVNEFSLDLIGKSRKFGMEVSGVSEEGVNSSFKYSNDKLTISTVANLGDVKTFKVKYHGIAQKGLVIDTTKFGQRSFFGDNWPNLARHWLPCVDHPYDKASIEFRIIAPNHYDVIATGKKVEESNLGGGLKLTTYIEPAPVPVKVITIGVTKFATKYLGTVDGIEVSAWVYPENRLDGFSDYKVAVYVLKYFIKKIGPYSYAKLANMQAKTQWGGLENAGTIAYFENSVTGKNTVEELIAHEIAHQWFGNSVTENSWNHVWLSEGFATYFAILYRESVHGNDTRKLDLEKDRRQVISYYKKNPSPIVDLSIKDPLKVLSPNTYQKAGWVLNMLRHKLGDEVFWKGIRLYYKTYKDSNAMTEDFRLVMEKVSGEELSEFFDQWLFTKGFPELELNWKYKKGKVVIQVNQLQNHHVFKFPLEIGIINDGKLKMEAVIVDEKSEIFKIVVDSRPEDIVFDPGVWLLFEESK